MEDRRIKLAEVAKNALEVINFSSLPSILPFDQGKIEGKVEGKIWGQNTTCTQFQFDDWFHDVLNINCICMFIFNKGKFVLYVSSCLQYKTDRIPVETETFEQTYERFKKLHTSWIFWFNEDKVNFYFGRNFSEKLLGFA